MMKIYSENKIYYKFTLLIIIICLVNAPLMAYWGQNGHRIVGEIASRNLTKKAKKNIEKVLGKESVAMASTFMDFIKANPDYSFLNPWHYATIPDTTTYKKIGTPEEGDVIMAIAYFTKALKTKQFEIGDEAFALRCLIHLVGDIHQPLHVGNGRDRGGNDVEVIFFDEVTNLHSVWDTGIIEKQNLSYTEYATHLNKVDKDTINLWQQHSPLQWARESKVLRDQVYQLPQDKRISYRYIYLNLGIVNQRLVMAGIRLAGLLNEIYG